MADISNSAWMFGQNANLGMEMQHGWCILRDIQAIITSAGDLSADGSIVGATSVTQVFTNGIGLSDVAAFSIVGTDTNSKLISLGSYAGNEGLIPQVNVGGTGFDFVPMAGASADLGVPTVRMATTTVLPGAPVYNNGAGTLTRSTNGTIGAIDGMAANTHQVGDTILVKDEVSALTNGKYVITTLGSGSVPYVLTRTTDSDTTAEFDEQVIGVSSGTANGGSTWGQTTSAPTVGTDPIVYVSQTGRYVTQSPSGTQAAGQVVTWDTQARRARKGTTNFVYDTASSTFLARFGAMRFQISGTTISVINNTSSLAIDSGAGSTILTDGTRNLTFNTALTIAALSDGTRSLTFDGTANTTVLTDGTRSITMAAAGSISIADALSGITMDSTGLLLNVGSNTLEINNAGNVIVATATNGFEAAIVTTPLVRAVVSGNLTLQTQTAGNDLTISTSTITVLLDDSATKPIVTAAAGMDVVATAGTITLTPATGWGTPTGTLLRAALSDASTATDVLQTLQALVTDLLTKGYLHA